MAGSTNGGRQGPTIQEEFVEVEADPQEEAALDEQIAQYQRKQALLLKNKQLEILKQNIATLERQTTDAVPPTGEADQPPDIEINLQGAPRSRGGLAPPANPRRDSSVGSAGSKRDRDAVSRSDEELALRPAPITAYYGKTYRELQDWKQECEIVFDAALRYFKSDTSRIRHAQLALRDTARSL